MTKALDEAVRIWEETWPVLHREFLEELAIIQQSDMPAEMRYEMANELKAALNEVKNLCIGQLAEIARMEGETLPYRYDPNKVNTDLMKGD